MAVWPLTATLLTCEVLLAVAVIAAVKWFGTGTAAALCCFLERYLNLGKNVNPNILKLDFNLFFTGILVFPTLLVT